MFGQLLPNKNKMLPCCTVLHSNSGPFIWLIIRLIRLVFSTETVFFSKKNSQRSRLIIRAARPLGLRRFRRTKHGRHFKSETVSDKIMTGHGLYSSEFVLLSDVLTSSLIEYEMHPHGLVKNKGIRFVRNIVKPPESKKTSTLLVMH
jgi:hypothetical protein